MRAILPIMPSETTAKIVAAIAGIPRGAVASYGQIAALVGLPNGARQVVRVLHACSDKNSLPWFRVVRKDGTIALPIGGGFELQRALLEEEGVEVGAGGRIDLARYGWRVTRNGRPPASRRGGSRVSRGARRNPGA
jgi:methylated-DNA-protein-cysteine methyltransferase related protein